MGSFLAGHTNRGTGSLRPSWRASGLPSHRLTTNDSGARFLNGDMVRQTMTSDFAATDDTLTQRNNVPGMRDFACDSGKIVVVG